MQAGTPFIGGGTGDAQEPTINENSVNKMVARLTDLQALNEAEADDDFHWYFYTGYILNTNKVV
jgi:hypothetical protein